MKIIITLSFIVIITLYLLTGCEHTTRSESDSSQSTLSDSYIEFVDDRVQSTYDQNEENNATIELNTLQIDYQDVPSMLNDPTLKNPTWAELEEFLKQDETDMLVYDSLSFDCTGFAITLRDQAWINGFRCGFVEVSFVKEGSGHALNAFQTIDKGLVYVDAIGNDKIAYLQLGQCYGVITMDAVKSEYIDCNRKSTAFLDLLTWDTDPILFSYDYYINYQDRFELYRESAKEYNIAIEEYNKGSKEYSYSELVDWYDNLEALYLDLGSIFYDPMDIVENVQVYWN